MKLFSGESPNLTRAQIHHAHLILEYLHRFSPLDYENELPIAHSHLLSLSPGLSEEPPLLTVCHHSQFLHPYFHLAYIRTHTCTHMHTHTILYISPIFHMYTKVPSGVDTKPFFQLSSWSVTGFVERLTTSVDWMKEGCHFELALEIYNILGIVYKFSRDYDKLVTTLNGYRDTAVFLLSEPTRVLPKYFRVGFYGQKAGDLAGKAYIYKVEAATSLLALTNRIKSSLATSVKSVDDVILLPNNPVDPKSLHPEKAYFQIASVSIFGTKGRRVGSGEWGKCGSGEAEQHHNCSHFLFEMSHEKTKKKKMIFQTRTPFPNVRCRIEIASQREVILSPIQAAIEVPFFHSLSISFTLSLSLSIYLSIFYIKAF